MLVIENPTILRLEGYLEQDRTILTQHLKYINRSVDFELRRLKKSGHQWGFSEKWEKRIEELESKRNGSLLFEDDRGFYTYSGLANKLSRLLQDEVVECKIKYPVPSPIPWHNEDKRNPYNYQILSKNKLIDNNHGAIEVATGLGKSKIILDIIRDLGLKTIILTPSTSIANQLLKEFQFYLGKKYIGQYFGGKKEPKKLIVVSVVNSLTLIEPDTEHWKLLENSQVLISDEAHTLGAETFSKVCLGLLKWVPRRFFFSATQIRQDGLQLLLDSIIGDVVYTKTLKEGVDEGYLAKPLFTLIQTTSDSNYTSSDAQRMTREHLFYNPKVNQIAGDITNRFCSQGKQVLILTEEIEQFSYLLPHFKYPVAYAHGTLDKSNIKSVPPPYVKSDPNQLVAEFNAGKWPILIGTSCISTGTDIKNNRATINLQGGKSEVSVKQGAIGRSTRLAPSVNKTTCHIIDFDVINADLVHRHAQERKAIYNSVYPSVKETAYVTD